MPTQKVEAMGTICQTAAAGMRSPIYVAIDTPELERAKKIVGRKAQVFSDAYEVVRSPDVEIVVELVRDGDPLGRRRCRLGRCRHASRAEVLEADPIGPAPRTSLVLLGPGLRGRRGWHRAARRSLP